MKGRRLKRAYTLATNVINVTSVAAGAADTPPYLDIHQIDRKTIVAPNKNIRVVKV